MDFLRSFIGGSTVMTERQTDTSGLYSLINTIVFILTLMAGMAAVYYGYIIGTDAILKEWQGHCSQFKDPVEYNNCMVLSFKLINHYTKLLLINLAIAIALPAIFWGGGRLYRRYSRHL